MRTSNFFKNLFSGVGIQLVQTLSSFVTRTVLIHCLSEDFLGINGLFASILTVLNLGELGIGASIVFAMYKPVADNDTEKIKSLMDLYRRAYRLVGFIFLGAGLLLLPALPYLTHGGTPLVNIQVVYVITILETVCSYWFFAYKSAILSASQKNYLITDVVISVVICKAVGQTGALLLLRNNPALSYYIYCAVGMAASIAQNVAVKFRVDRAFPFLKEKNIRPLTREERRPIVKNVFGMTTNRVCQVLNDGIDNTIISAFLGLGVLGIYTNYLTLRTMVNSVLRILFGSVHASVGNLCAVESTERKEEFFRAFHFAYFWIYGFCAICLYILLDSFIAGVWVRDTRWLIPGGTVFLLVFNFLIEGLAGAVVKFRDVNGLYWQTKFRYILSSVLNAVLSIVLTGPLKMGVSGALLGTTVSLAVMLSYDPVLVYREVFHKKAGEYYRMYFRDLGIVLLTGGIVYAACLPFSAYTAGNFLIRLGLCLVIPNGLWYIVFRHDSRFLYLRDTLLRYIRRAGKKRKE